PLEERDLPAEFVSQTEDEQDRRVESVLRAVMRWARRVGCDQLRASLSIAKDRDLARAAGMSEPLDANPAWPGVDFEAPFDIADVGLLLQIASPDRMWITRAAGLVVYVHETWDSVVIAASETE